METDPKEKDTYNKHRLHIMNEYIRSLRRAAQDETVAPADIVAQVVNDLQTLGMFEQNPPSNPQIEAQHLFKASDYGDFIHQPQNSRVILKPQNRPVHLTPIENAILHTLGTRRGQLVSFETLIQSAWKPEDVPFIGPKELKPPLSRLRQKIRDQRSAEGFKYIESIKHRGYRFKEENSQLDLS